MALIGGGLAGLTLAIQLAYKGYSVILFEKERYPFHKVCGEYISLESIGFMKKLGVDPGSLNAANITRLVVSSLNGKILEQDLLLGGIGISRYVLDHALMQIAVRAGVCIKENVKVRDVAYNDGKFDVISGGNLIKAKLVCGSYGKRANLDIKFQRTFMIEKENRLNNYVGVKYHIRGNFPPHEIALHNFSNGYCGLVKIEDDKYCLCYLTRAINLKRCGGSIPEMEKQILSANPHLKKIFRDSEKLYEQPLTISQISFDRKSQVEDHVLMIGDAAGMITPLCGNGMSMAMHGSKLAFKQIDLFLQGQISREQMEHNYSEQWQKEFSARLKMGRRIQRLFGNDMLTNGFISVAKLFPSLTRYLIRKTHGSGF